jgi:hypothetical protein
VASSSETNKIKVDEAECSDEGNRLENLLSYLKLGKVRKELLLHYDIALCYDIHPVLDNDI